VRHLVELDGGWRPNRYRRRRPEEEPSWFLSLKLLDSPAEFRFHFRGMLDFAGFHSANRRPDGIEILMAINYCLKADQCGWPLLGSKLYSSCPGTQGQAKWETIARHNPNKLEVRGISSGLQCESLVYHLRVQ
jgi:hypothetical protein